MLGKQEGTGVQAQLARLRCSSKDTGEESEAEK